jgi:signal transduction histidine kinase
LLGVVLWAGLSGRGAAAADADAVTRASATNPPLITLRQFLDGAPVWGENRPVRVRGTVTHSISDKTYFIQEGDAGTYVFHKPTNAFQAGELVEVVGYPSLTSLPTLQRCDARSLGPGTLPVPRVVSAAEARSQKCHMLLVRVQGVLAPARLRNGHILVLDPGDGRAFTADLESLPSLEPFDHLEPGSLLQVTGVCTARRSPSKTPASFSVFVSSPSDIVVLRPPPWWTPARAARSLVLAAVGLILALTWVMTLRVQVRRQTADIRRLNDQLEQRVRDRTAELSDANRQLESFNYSVSHDLRAPLRHITGFADLAASHPTVAQDPEVQRRLQQIIAAASRLGGLMDDLLAFSRMARQPLAVQTVDLAPMVAEIQRELQAEASGRRLEWRVAQLPDVQGDPTLLRLVWQNLLENAVKYTRGRETSVIEVGCQPGVGEWIFLVRDNGAGFDPRAAERLFGLFQRLHHEDEFEGTGIGLANARRIIERHGGRIWAEAQLDRGATFFFTLPRLPARGAAPAADQGLEQAAGAAGSTSRQP